MPPFQVDLVLKSADQPISTVNPGPSAPVRQATKWRQPRSPVRLYPAASVSLTGSRQNALARRKSISFPIGIAGNAIIGRDWLPLYWVIKASFCSRRSSCQTPSAIIAATASPTINVAISGSRFIRSDALRAHGCGIREPTIRPWRS